MDKEYNLKKVRPRPIVLIILDGWGESEALKHNAIKEANTPCWDKIWQECPHTLLSASGLSVGLPEGQMGNSEVGHLTMGAGRVIFQDLTRIDESIRNKEFFKNPVFLNAIHNLKKTSHTLHIFGLISDGGVHSHLNHFKALIELCKQEGFDRVAIHAFLDGRDTPPKSALGFLESLEEFCKERGVGRIVSVMGRYYAMDRDKRWERTEVAYQLLTEDVAPYHAKSIEEAINMAYQRGETDEFVKPTLIDKGFLKGTPHSDTSKILFTDKSVIQDGDSVIFMNFRADRARQLSHALTDETFNGFQRKVFPKLKEFITLTPYAADLKAEVAFLPVPLNNILGEVLEQHHLKQLRIAETEKYAHVTYFINGGREQPFVGEDRILIPSPKVATYDLQPEMSAPMITEKLVETIRSEKYDVIICNFANADMLGHTGDFKATVQSIETLDACLNKILNALKDVGGEAILTSDHGNAECMFDEKTKQPHTAHTTSLIPFIYIGRKAKIRDKNNPEMEYGSLSDVAPTILTLLNIHVPSEMTGKSLIEI